MGLKKPLVNSGIDTSDATATVNDIANGKTAYAGGGKVTGNYVPPTVQSLTADADAIAGDIVSGKTAYVNGVKIAGSLEKEWLVSGEVAGVNSPVKSITIPNINFTPKRCEIRLKIGQTGSGSTTVLINYDEQMKKWEIHTNSASGISMYSGSIFIYNAPDFICSGVSAYGSTNIKLSVSITNNTLVFTLPESWTYAFNYIYKVG